MINISALKQMYSSAPAGVRQIFEFLPPVHRFSPDYHLWRARLVRARSDSEWAAGFARRRLACTLSFCLDHVPYYAEMAADAGFRELARIQPFEALPYFPIITKSALLERFEEFIPARWVFGGSYLASTGGSTGAPLKIRISNRSWGAEWAFVFDYLSRLGIGDGDPRISLRGVRFGGSAEPVELNPVYRELRVSPFHLDERSLPGVARAVEHFNARYIHGYPSSIGNFLDLLGSQAPRVLGGVKAVLCVSEDVSGEFVERVKRVLPGVVVGSFYGMTERVAFIERTNDGAWQPNRLYGHVEVVDRRIVATGYLNMAFPLVRYDTGDLAEMVAGVIVGVGGRWNHAPLSTACGTAVSMTALNLHSAAFSEIGEYQFVQISPGCVEFRYIRAGAARDTAARQVAAEFSSKCEGTISFTALAVDRLHLSKAGKRPLVVSSALGNFGGDDED